MNNKFLSAPFVLPALVIGIAILLSSFVGAVTFLKARGLDDALSVTGSAKMRVTADSVKWSFNISRRVTEYTLQNGYSDMAKDLTAVKNFLSQNGLKEEQITIAPIYMEEMYKDPNSSGPREITLRQSIMVQSTDVAGITSLAKSTETLSRTGIFLSSFSPEYFYSKLADLRVSLLSNAIKDAKARANEIAKSSGQSVGSLKSASSGVVQVLAPNSVEVDSYGSYDTSSIEKDVMVTVRAVFFVK